MEANPIFAAQLLSALTLVVFLVLGARVVWRNYFSRDFMGSFPNLMKECFDCSCPRGWEKPVRRALRELSRLQRRRCSGLQVLQIKEKFGGLRIYTDRGADPIIERAERACHFRCQVCGRPGSHRVLGGWHATLCDGCEQDKKAARNCQYRSRT